MGTGYTNYWGDTWDSKWQWASKFAWLPAKMDNGELVWWRKYYHGVRMISGPGTPVYLHQYMTVEDFTWSALKES
jgi:hypothetical protein